MSQRETRLKPLTLLQIGGVNQRVHATELPPQEYVTLNGVFPEFAGLQSRIWGKRVLQKYPNPIYGIHQFWTPLGYGGGLYQFSGTVDFGQWLTPTSNLNLDIPPLLTDGGGMTLDEFGNGYGSNFGYGTDNMCVISFLNGSTDHTACLPPVAPANDVNDHNGGPAGQGKACRWESVVEDRDLGIYAIERATGGYSGRVVAISVVDNCRDPATGQNPPCVNYPPIPVPPAPIGDPSSYSVVALSGNLTASKTGSSYAIFNEPSNSICSAKTSSFQINAASNTRLTINLSPLLLEDIDFVSLLLNVNGDEKEIELTPTPLDIVLDAQTYMLPGGQVANANYGYDSASVVSGNQLRIRKRRRVCT